MQQFFSFEPESEAAGATPRGAVYTRPWVVELILDLAGYIPGSNLVDVFAVEPAAGEGAFLIAMVRRLVASCNRQGRAVIDCTDSLVAYEIDERSARIAKATVVAALGALGVASETSGRLAASWVRTGDYLEVARHLPAANLVVGNPPYIRLEDIPEATMEVYRAAYPTMQGRADLYVAFFEAALRQLKDQGVCAYICADRWMFNQYGASLRQFVTSSYNVETVVEMHNADAFHSNVSAYPAITVIRRERQGTAVVARATASLSSVGTAQIASFLRLGDNHDKIESPSPALSSAVINRWFVGSDPWPCRSPRRLATLRRLEERFPTLEDGKQTRIGIGVATGCDDVFIIKDEDLVEASRILPLAMASDTFTGTFSWSGHYLVDPWDAAGLVPLERFPRLQAYLGQHKERLKMRHTARRNPHAWYRTIDRITHSLTTKRKLLIPDIKHVFNPVLDEGMVYPHHNLYFICSDAWDLEVLGGILLSAIGQFFVEAYGVRMRGGYLRFQAQYLRRIRVPHPRDIRKTHALELVQAFRDRDRDLATAVALEIYEVDPNELE